jgi:flavin-dependent dehydrogenase
VWDLLVIGAGPAGCAAAIRARRAGLSVKMLELSERARVAPGETLHPGIEPLFEALGVREALVSAGFHRHRGVWVSWNAPCRFEPYGVDASGPWLGFQATRHRLHEILLDAALGLGVDVQRGARPEALLREGHRVSGVLASGSELRARWTADATGRRAWLARELRLANRHRSPRMLARFGWIDDGLADLDGQPRIVATPDGWRWHAPLGRARTAWVSLTVGDSRESRPGGGIDVSWSARENCAGAGYFLLGDAAATLDPLSSHGVLRAIMSGMLCAHLVAAHAGGTVSAPQVISAYVGWMRDQFERDVVVLRTLYRDHPARALAELFREA